MSTVDRLAVISMGHGTGSYQTHLSWGAMLGCLRVGTWRSCGVVRVGVLPRTGSHCFWCGATVGRARVLCRGEYNRCGCHANAESDRLRRNSSAGTTRKHGDRASLRSRMRLHRHNPKKLVGFFHECGLQIPWTQCQKTSVGTSFSLCVWQGVLPQFRTVHSQKGSRRQGQRFP